MQNQTTSPIDTPAIKPGVSVAIIAFIALVILFAIPRPETVTPQGWRMLAIFVCTVVALMLRPIAGGAAVLIGVVASILTQAQTPAQAMSGYGSTTVWLVLSAFFISRAIINSGLARRLALIFIRAIGQTSLGLGYALAGCDVVMASVIPGNSARIGGILLPIARTLSTIYESHPGKTASLLGTYLVVTIYQGDMLACAMYLTGQASNPIAADLAAKTFGVSMTWPEWLWAAFVPGLAAFVIVPWFIYQISPPGIRHTPQAAGMARKELLAMGPLNFSEKKVIAVFLLVCGLWATSSLHSLNVTTVALLGVSVLLATNALHFSDMVQEKTAWDVFVWYGGIIRMGEALNESGVTKAFADGVSTLFTGWQWPAMMAIVVILYFYVHYLFASVTTHLLSLYVPFVTILIAAGAPAPLVAFSLAFYANLSASLTHYGTTPGPILFAAGYVAHGTWWKVGLFVSFVNLAIWTAVGLVWWKIIGLW
ncbi:MAG: DASS family sodium-coupled anion symporter [Acidobacteria bacterium]|nr:DASS family sodium-coupled anion symporter [Acidobacteriota bacterium]